jgi:hypothetical protein
VGLVLRAVDVVSPWRWRWLLSEEAGPPLASHLVNLDPASEKVAAFRNLYEFARWRAAPDRRRADQFKIVADAGAWAGRELLGEDIGAAIAAEAPTWVRVSVPAPADQIMMWPLELAHANGRPLAARGDVSLVYDIVPGAAARRKEPVGDALRVLAVFSQPTQTSVLALRQERYALSRLMRQIAAREGAAVELQVVQYGVTRERFAQIADSGNGWDMLHLAGHGGPGQFLLEHADGSPDQLEVADLIDLLRPTRHRLKLAMVSACESATETVTETLRLVGLTDEEPAEAEPAASQAATEVTGVARALVRDLECAVVAMRYPVTDQFAIALGEAFYEHLLVRRHPVDVATARAVAQAAGAGHTALRRALSLATPGVFGLRSAGLALPVPRGQPRLDPAAQKMAHFPDEPERFVGRTQAMATASAVLAPRSDMTTVLLHGMAGSGKTACALELAYRHQDAFAAAAFWQAPTRRDEWNGALADFANRLETQLRDYQFTMAAHIGTEAALRAYLPRLRHVMRNGGLLLVLDNLETLLTPGGSWLDPRWELLIGALTSHGGESRLIMTSQTVPAGLGAGGVKLPVHALSLDESAALARELPHLRGLLHADEGADGDEGPLRGRDTAGIEADRERLRRVLRVVQGHPKLLEFADAAAADRETLDAQLDAAEQAADRQQLEAFFRVGISALGTGQFLGALAGWTAAALAALPPQARLMSEFLACLEDDDRKSFVIEATWPELWRRLERPGDPPADGPLLAALAAVALVEAEAAPDSPGEPGLVNYRMHPGVTAAVVAAAGADVREAADVVLASFWPAAASLAHDRDGGGSSGVVVRAGLAAAPYLLRRGAWDAAGDLLEDAVIRDGSPGTVQAALPSLRRIAGVTGTPKAAGALARALVHVNPGEAERLLRSALHDSVGAGDYRAASAAAGILVILLRDAGRLAEALETAERKPEYTRLGGLGRWTQLADQGLRLQVLGLMGEHARVLAEIPELRAAMAGLPDRPASDEAVTPWNVREGILDIGRSSALATRDQRQALDLNAEVAASMRQRGAGEHEVAGTRFNDTGPMIRLGQLDGAERLLTECQQIFEDHGDVTALAKVFTARASLESRLGHLETAADLERTALRLSYIRPEPEGIAISHLNLAVHLKRRGGDRAGQQAHLLAAALVFHLTGATGELGPVIHGLSGELREDAGAGHLPSTVAEVIRVAELAEGVRLGELLADLEPDPQALEDVLAEILRVAAALPPEEEEDELDLALHLQSWTPVIDEIDAAYQAGREPSADLIELLDERAGQPDWADLVAVLRRVLAGERGAALLRGLDEIDTAIVRETLARLGE